jgi:hypothetical protein
MSNQQRLEQVAREDMVLFINACFACTGQSEYYGESAGQAVAISFLHEYILGNYRSLYARTLAAGINHFNQGLIITNLLSCETPKDPSQKKEEGELLRAALRSLPPPRAYRALVALRENRISHRRAKAVALEYITHRPDLAFDAVKYKNNLRSLSCHFHFKLTGETNTFLFENSKRKTPYETPLFESYRRAFFDEEAVYELPYTIAEGFASVHQIERGEFLQKIAPRLTQHERLRLQQSSQEEGAEEITVHLSALPLTKLAVFILSLPYPEREARREELQEAMKAAALRTAGRTKVSLGKVVVVLDRSASSFGSAQKKKRPLAVALAASYLLRAIADHCVTLWTPPLPHETPPHPGMLNNGTKGEGEELFVTARGQTDLATPLLDALAHQPDVVVIVSDGFENDPPNAAAEVARVFRKNIDPKRKTSIIHMNPVFDSERYAPKTLGPAVPTVGLRDAEDLLTMIGFARFAEGAAPLSELESYLAQRVERFLRKFSFDKTNEGATLSSQQRSSP